ncbi:MAG: hypothetical protein EOM03_14800 [Clostridia bacterium]|nr:hypothetical protein [Clostridia bacterium]
MKSLSEKLIASWPAPIVARSEVGKFSGGTLHSRTMANLDALKQGPGKITIGGKVAYDRDALARWIEARSTVQA